QPELDRGGPGEQELQRLAVGERHPRDPSPNTTPHRGGPGGASGDRGVARARRLPAPPPAAAAPACAGEVGPWFRGASRAGRRRRSARAPAGTPPSGTPAAGPG